VWESISLSDPGKSWTTPRLNEKGLPVARLRWSAAEPWRVISDAHEVVVAIGCEVQRFKVVVRMSNNGLMLKCSEGSTRRIRKVLAKAGEGSHYQFDYWTRECVVYAMVERVSLLAWMELQRHRSEESQKASQ
jgi:hypothetical protein